MNGTPDGGTFFSASWGGRDEDELFSPVSNDPPQQSNSVVRVTASNFPRLMHCPDLLSLHHLCSADHPRGRVVRAFFWLMRAWPVPRARGAR